MNLKDKELTNQDFLKHYDRLGFAEWNECNKSRTVTWDQIDDILFELDVQFLPPPAVSVHTIFYVKWNINLFYDKKCVPYKEILCAYFEDQHQKF